METTIIEFDMSFICDVTDMQFNATVLAMRLANDTDVEQAAVMMLTTDLNLKTATLETDAAVIILRGDLIVVVALVEVRELVLFTLLRKRITLAHEMETAWL